jgi:hypothetical protein
MNETKEEDKSPSTCRDGECYCPVCTLTRIVRGTKTKHSAFFDHISNAQIELLRALRSLVDERIDSIEKRKGAGEKKNTAFKVEVE